MVLKISPSEIIMSWMSFASGIYLLVAPEQANNSTILSNLFLISSIGGPAYSFSKTSDYACSSWKLSWRALGIPLRYLEMLELEESDEDILFFIILTFSLFINYFFYSLLLQLTQIWKDFDRDHPALETIILPIPPSSSHDVFLSWFHYFLFFFLHAGKNILSGFL